MHASETLYLFPSTCSTDHLFNVLFNTWSTNWQMSPLKYSFSWTMKVSSHWQHHKNTTSSSSAEILCLRLVPCLYIPPHTHMSSSSLISWSTAFVVSLLRGCTQPSLFAPSLHLCSSDFLIHCPVWAEPICTALKKIKNLIQQNIE